MNKLEFRLCQDIPIPIQKLSEPPLHSSPRQVSTPTLVVVHHMAWLHRRIYIWGEGGGGGGGVKAKPPRTHLNESQRISHL